MTVTVVALVTLNEDEPQALAEYLEATTPLLDYVGAKIRQRIPILETVVGPKLGQSMIIVDYPDREAVRAVFESDIYRKIIPVRDRAFLNYHVSILGNDPDGGAKTDQISG